MSRESGRLAYHALRNSKHYAWIDADEIMAEDAARVFLPPVAESNVQIPMPLPKARQEWLAGFREAQADGKTLPV